MPSYPVTLRLLAPIFLVVGALHLVLGLHADALLGARLSLETLSEPSLDSQNRFYGVAFAYYGVVLWLGASDPERFRPVVVALFAVFFLGGAARLVAWALYGPPAPLVVVLGAIELGLPPAMLLWSRRAGPDG